MTYRDIELDPDFRAQLQRLLGAPADATRTLGDLADLWAGAARPGLDDLVADSPTRHRASVGEEHWYTHCFFDALLLPFILEASPVEVHTTSPQSGRSIDAHVTPEQAATDPASAVVSFGAFRQGDGPATATLCPTINAFADLAEYQAWAASHPEVATVPLAMADAFAFAQDFVGSGPLAAARDAMGPR